MPVPENRFDITDSHAVIRGIFISNPQEPIVLATCTVCGEQWWEESIIDGICEDCGEDIIEGLFDDD